MADNDPDPRHQPDASSQSPGDANAPQPRRHDPSKALHLWEYRWARDLIVIAIAVAFLWLVYQVRTVLAPVVVALALAYIVNPLVTWMELRRVPRWLGTSVLMGAAVVALAGLFLGILPGLVGQGVDLVAKLPDQTRQVAGELGYDIDEVMLRVRSAAITALKKELTGLLPEAEDDPAFAPPPVRRSTPPPAAQPSDPPEPDHPPDGADASAVPGSDDAGGPDGEAASSTVDASTDPEPGGREDQANPPRAGPAADDPQVAGDQPASENDDPSLAQGDASTDAAADGAVGEGADAILSPQLDYALIARGVGRAVEWFIRLLQSMVMTASSVLLFSFITLVCFFYFSWRFEATIRWFDQFIPRSRRLQTIKIAHRMDRAVAAWLRGRLFQSLVVAVILSVGFLLVGVPYWLLLGVAGGLLNLIPYAAVLIWPVAIGLAAAGRLSNGQDLDILWTLVAPSAVYIIAQSVDGWVLEPLVQGQATELHWVVVLIAVLIGGSLAGFLGLLLAIPAAACLKILSEEIIFPQLREYVRRMG